MSETRLWQQTVKLSPKSYTCGYCGRVAGSNAGYSGKFDPHRGSIDEFIYICTFCACPTYFGRFGEPQVPGPIFGNSVSAVPADVIAVYEEARRCMSVAAYTSAVLSCRKLLMNIAVKKGAGEGWSFAKYIDHLAKEGYVPRDSEVWIDKVRTEGNEATHEIALKSKLDAELLIGFCEMLLKFVFEFPARVVPSSKTP